MNFLQQKKTKFIEIIKKTLFDKSKCTWYSSNPANWTYLDMPLTSGNYYIYFIGLDWKNIDNQTRKYLCIIEGVSVTNIPQVFSVSNDKITFIYSPSLTNGYFGHNYSQEGKKTTLEKYQKHLMIEKV